jgi:hypothetical protein
MGANCTPIQMEWFYYLEGEKTKLNWLLLETALEHFFRIRDSDMLQEYRKEYSDKQIAQFCTYYARRMKKSMLNYLRGRNKRVLHYRDYVDDFYPHHGDQLNRALEDAGVDAWTHMLSACANCPVQCPYDYKARSPQFDEWKE